MNISFKKYYFFQFSLYQDVLSKEIFSWCVSDCEHFRIYCIFLIKNAESDDFFVLCVHDVLINAYSDPGQYFQ